MWTRWWSSTQRRRPTRLHGLSALFSQKRMHTWYVTNRKRMVVIVADTQTTLYSPDDVGGFLEAIRAVMI